MYIYSTRPRVYPIYIYIYIYMYIYINASIGSSRLPVDEFQAALIVDELNCSPFDSFARVLGLLRLDTHAHTHTHIHTYIDRYSDT